MFHEPFAFVIIQLLLGLKEAIKLSAVSSSAVTELLEMLFALLFNIQLLQSREEQITSFTARFFCLGFFLYHLLHRKGSKSERTLIQKDKPGGVGSGIENSVRSGVVALDAMLQPFRHFSSRLVDQTDLGS